MVPVNRGQESQNTEAEKEKKEESNEAERAEAAEPKGDPEMAPFYVQHLLPVFTDIFHSSMLASVRYGNGAARVPSTFQLKLTSDNLPSLHTHTHTHTHTHIHDQTATSLKKYTLSTDE